MSKEPDVLWSPRSTGNKKTGDIPTAWVGGSRQQSLESCAGCPLLTNRNCYAQFGSAAMGHGHMVRARNEGGDYSLEHALTHRNPSATIVRVAALGEPGRMSLTWWQKLYQMCANPPNIIRGRGWLRKFANKPLAIVAYIHNWKSRPDLAGMAMASCDTLEQVDEAHALGFRATVVLPRQHSERTFTTPGGARGIVCPAQQSDGKVSCNECKLCVPQKAGPVIGFRDHGPMNRGYRPHIVPTANDVLTLVKNVRDNGPIRTDELVPDTRLTRRSTRKMLARLEKAGIVQREREYGRHHGSDTWTYLGPAPFEVSGTTVDLTRL